MSQKNPGPPRPPQGGPPAQPGNPQRPSPPATSQVPAAAPMESADVPGPLEPEALPYGKHLVDNQHGGPTRESVKRRVGLPGSLSIILSSIYAAILLLGIGVAILGFITTAGVLELNKNSGPSGGTEPKGAKSRKLVLAKKKEEEARDQQYQSDRRALFASFGIGMVMSFTALTGQMAGIVSGLNMVKLRNYRWAFWANVFAAIPFVSTFYVVLFFATADADKVGGAAIILMMLIVYGAFDAARFGMSFVCLLSLFSARVRKFFEMK